MAKWAEIAPKHKLYRLVRTGGIYRVLNEGLEVTNDEAVPSIVYQNEEGQVFIQAKSRFEDGRFEEVESDIYSHGFNTPGDIMYDE